MRRGLSWRGGFVVAALVVGPASAADPEPTSAWKLGLSDMARYDRRRVSVKDGVETLGRVDLAAVHGHDLRDGGLYLPVSPQRGDLPAIFALRTPAVGAFEWRVHLFDSVELRVKGAATVASRTAESVELRVEATFASAGKAAEFDAYVLKDGKARATISFDVAAGAVKSARVETSYVREKVDPKKTDKPATVNDVFAFELASVVRFGKHAAPDDVNAAIDRGIAHLRTLQKENGAFEPLPNWDVGTTALCAYTLLSCGATADDPAVDKALTLICVATPTKTYEQAVSLMAVERAYAPPEASASRRAGAERRPARELPPFRRAWAERTAAALEGNCSSPGLWGYPYAGNSLVRADSSNTQYAVLGMQAAAKLGIAVKEATWLGVIRHFSNVRDGDGPRGSVLLLRAGQAITETAAATPVAKVAGFHYSTDETRTWGSMTCAGVASLSIVKDELRRMKSPKFGAKQEDEVDEMVAGAWAWLDRHWGMDRHPEKPGHDWYFYWLYSLERAAVLDAVQRVGGRDWYFEGAAELLARQAKDGSWDEDGGTHTTETCFALLFLKRATAPLTPK
jgi:hypothetical protein